MKEYVKVEELLEEVDKMAKRNTLLAIFIFIILHFCNYFIILQLS